MRHTGPPDITIDDNPQLLKVANLKGGEFFQWRSRVWLRTHKIDSDKFIWCYDLQGDESDYLNPENEVAPLVLKRANFARKEVAKQH